MNWEEFWYGLQLLSEERIGTLVRREVAQEDAAFQAATTPESED